MTKDLFKKRIGRQVFLTAVFTFILCYSSFGQNTITLNPLGTGSEGNTRYTDESEIQIDASGVASYFNSTQYDDWTVSGTTVSHPGALNKTFKITFGTMATVSTVEGNDFGKMLTAGGIDRANNGAVGVRGGVGNGIDFGEGVYFGLDLTNISANAAIQITKISVSDLNAVNETGMLVSRLNPSKRIIFGKAGSPNITYELASGAGVIDVSSLNLYVTGGQVNDEIVSIFNNYDSGSGFRVTDVELKVLSNDFTSSVVTGLSHPRLLLKQGEEAAIQTLISQSPEFNNIHNHIISQADVYLTNIALTYNPSNNRLLETARSAINQIFYLSYAYRMTNQLSYLTKAEAIMNTVCDFPDWVTYSLDVAEMCFAVSIGYDWLYSGLQETTKTKAREKILNYAFLTQKTSPFWDYSSNWNQVCISGLTFGALAILGDGTAQMDQEANYILNRILVKNPNSMDTYANGNYQEGPMYWSYGTNYEVLMLAALEKIYGESHEGINRLTYTPGFLESAEYMQYVTGTSSLYFNYSDGTEKRIPLLPTLWMAKKLNQPSILSVEKELMQNGRYTSNYSDESRFLPIALIYGKEIDLSNLSYPTSKLWQGYGDQPVTLVRTDWQGANGKYVGIKAGTPTYSHAHMDGGSFVYDSQGLRWGLDFEKEDYDAVNAGMTPAGTLSNFSQNSSRWNVFRLSNLNHNTISIKKSSESGWQHHKAIGKATVTEVYDTDLKRGSKIDLKDVIGLDNELDAVDRSVYMVNNSYLEIQDYIDNGATPIDLYWNMVTKALVEVVSPSKLKLTQGGKTVELEVVSSNPLVSFTLSSNRSTDPVDYFASATYERKNTGTVMIGFEATIPANEVVTFTVTLKDGLIVPPSSTELVNNILLELPNPTTGQEGNAFYFDQSELHIAPSGDVSIGGISSDYAWNVYGQTNINDALNKKLFFGWQGMGTTNTTVGSNYGAMLTQAGIDRAANGELGIRGGVGNGIDPNEGFNLGFNTFYLPENVGLKLVKVGVNFVTNDRSGVIVNRKNTALKKTFGGSSASADIILPSGSGFVNVEDLDIVLYGGEVDYDLASVFNTGTSGGFRINKFVFEVVNTDQLILSIKDEISTKQKNKDATDEHFVVYPNPFIESVTLQNIQKGNGDIEVKLFSTSGVCLLDKSYHFVANDERYNLQLDLKSLQAGIYLIQITDSKGNYKYKKIIKH